METERVDYALETAAKMINVLYPNVDIQTRTILLQTLLPNLLQLSNGKGLELVLPVPKDNEEEIDQ